VKGNKINQGYAANSRNAGPVYPVQSSVLDERALLEDVIKNFEIPKPKSCRFLTRGAADIYRIRSVTANYYLKVYRPPQTIDQCEAEALFVSALAASSIPVVKPVPRGTSRYAIQVCAPE